MNEEMTSGAFGTAMETLSRFHDYKQLGLATSGYSRLFTVISGERKLLLKAVNREDGSEAENFARLQREYRILERLYGNEHIVRCIDWRDDSVVGPCIVMEYVDGMCLSDYLSTSPSNRERHRILSELTDALSFIHSHQVVHNDLKSENILITRNGHSVKLIDFGYSDSDADIDKATGGTKAFAAPELLRRSATDVTSDIYSLGFIIKALFPHRYGLVVHRCQHKEPSKRYQRMAEVNTAILRCQWLWRVAIVAVFACVAAVAALWWRYDDGLPQEAPYADTICRDSISSIDEHDTASLSTDTLPARRTAEPQHPVGRYETTDAALGYDTILQIYDSIYNKYMKTVKDGIADGSLKYREFVLLYLQKYVEEIEEVYNRADKETQEKAGLGYSYMYNNIDIMSDEVPSMYTVKDSVIRDSIFCEFEKQRKILGVNHSIWPL